MLSLLTSFGLADPQVVVRGHAAAHAKFHVRWRYAACGSVKELDDRAPIASALGNADDHPRPEHEVLSQRKDAHCVLRDRGRLLRAQRPGAEGASQFYLLA